MQFLHTVEVVLEIGYFWKNLKEILMRNRRYFSEYGLTYKILDNFDALENQNYQRKNYLEFCLTSHIPRKDHYNRFCTIL